MKKSKDEIKKVLEKYSNIEERIKKTVVHTSSKDIVGNVVKNTFVVYVGSYMYAITEYEGGSFFGFKVSQCSGSMDVGAIPPFNIMEAAKEHADSGFSGGVESLTELYMSIGILPIDEMNFINENYKILFNSANNELKKERLQYAISQAVKKEDFKQASELKDKLDELD